MEGCGGIAAEAGQKLRTHIGAESPSQGRINIIVIVASINPGEGLGVPIRRVGGGSPKLLDHHSVIVCGDRHLGVPSTCRYPLIVVDVRGVEDAVTGGCVRQCISGKACQVIGPGQSPGDDDVVGPGVSNGGHQLLHPGRVISRLGRISVGGHGTAVFPSGPKGAVRAVRPEGFVKEIE